MSHYDRDTCYYGQRGRGACRTSECRDEDLSALNLEAPVISNGMERSNLLPDAEAESETDKELEPSNITNPKKDQFGKYVAKLELFLTRHHS